MLLYDVEMRQYTAHALKAIADRRPWYVSMWRKMLSRIGRSVPDDAVGEPPEMPDMSGMIADVLEFVEDEGREMQKIRDGQDSTQADSMLPQQDLMSRVMMGKGAPQPQFPRI